MINMDKKYFFRKLRSGILVLDGAMGTELQKNGFTKGCPEELNLINSEIVRGVHKSYSEAGADIIITNTFGANRIKLSEYSLQHKLREINRAGVRIARGAAPKCIIAGGLGPLGKYVEPLGSITFDEAYNAYQEQVRALGDADIFIIETMDDVKILKAAIIAAKESEKIVIASMAFEGDRTVTGTDAETFVVIAGSLGADIIGINCGSGPNEHHSILKQVVQYTDKPIMVKPNAGLPRLVNGRTVFKVTPEEFGGYARKFAERGVSIIGGCCGTNAEHVKAIKRAVRGMKPRHRRVKMKTKLCSRTRTVTIDGPTAIVGERINPTNKKDLQTEIAAYKTDLIKRYAMEQAKEGATLLDINLGVPGIDEAKIFKKAVGAVQNIVDIPLVIDTVNVKALEEALKQSDGKPLINSVNGSEKSLNAVLPLAKRFGAGIIALTFDENGIPDTKEERLRIAKKIISRAEKIGINRQNIVVDFLTMTLATDRKIDDVLTGCIREIKKEGYKTILGISNISYGLPNRNEINSKFFSRASKAGLDLAIMNPADSIITDDTKIRFLCDVKIKAEDYADLPVEKQLYNAILYGDEENIATIVEEGLKKLDPLDINDILVSALKEVGNRFKNKTYFLPQVLLSAEAMKNAFARLKMEINKKGGKPKTKIIIATVENDIHDIGKNIVAALLESHNYEVIDLGKSVPTEKIINAALKQKPDLVALSALMTTTVQEMENVINELKKHNIKVAVIVGGAVVTEEYAKSIGALYARNALEAVDKLDEMLKK